MKTIKATTVLKVAKSNVISNAIKFTHNDINYSVIYDKDFFLQAVNEKGEYKVIARIING